MFTFYESIPTSDSKFSCMTLSIKLDLDRGQGEPLHQISRSTVILFKLLSGQTHTHTHIHPTECSIWNCSCW